ncbi:hypothetical protein ASE19_19555 [Nocardioides sp. Root79]|nr:hypothetical protein ASE19_19555 [Nocardioides sp. Root79]KRC75482.1 hypothetical protein ASE20_21460 [Nocardioides sp. Root240]
MTASDVGNGAEDYDSGGPILAGCLSTIENSFGKARAQLEGQWSYMTAGKPVSVDEYIISYPDDMDIASLFADVGTAIKKCPRVDVKSPKVSIRMNITESRSAQRLDVDGELGFVAVGQVGTPGRLDPIIMKVTYLLVGPNIVRVSTKALDEDSGFHEEMVQVAHRRLEAAFADR